jgi:hypothetical protein
MKTFNLKFAVAIYLAAMVAMHAFLFWSLRHEIENGYSDFAIFYSAGRIVDQGQGNNLYDSALQFRTQQEFSPDVHIRQGALPYNHPPFEALIFVPLARLQYFPAYLLWDLLNLLILISLPFVLRPHVPLLRCMPASICLLATAAYFPIFLALLQGQDIILLLILFSLTYVALKKNADFTAGCWLGLGLFRFHLVLPLVFIFCLHKKRKAMLGFTAVATLLGLISIEVVGWKGTLAYPSYVLHLEAIGGHGAIIPGDMPNLRGLFDILLPQHSYLLGVGLTLVSSLVLFFLASAKWRETATDAKFDLVFSLIIVVTVLVSYHALAYDLSLLLLPTLLVLSHLQTSVATRKPFALLAPILILFFGPLLMFLSFRTHQSSLLALVLLFWVWGLSHEMSSVQKT